jgi:hypothetical protein
MLSICAFSATLNGDSVHQKSAYLVAVVLISTIGTSATASTADDRLPYGFPVYAIDAACNAAFANAPDEDRRSHVLSCLDQEQKALELLKARWKNPAGQVEDLCETESRGSYLRLYQCVALKEKQEKSPFQIMPKRHASSSPNR